MPERILVIGDSLVYGAHDKEDGGWVHRLRLDLDRMVPPGQRPTYSVYNLGVRDDTTRKLLTRFESEVESRVKEGDSLFLMFGIGVNDSRYVNSLDTPEIPADTFRENLGKILQIAQKLTQKIIFIGLAPVNDAKISPFPHLPDKTYTTERVKTYNNIIKTFCQENNVHFIDIFSVFISLNYHELLEDGLHPNSKGHELIFRSVKEYLKENGMIR